jgi:hypothetical protein
MKEPVTAQDTTDQHLQDLAREVWATHPLVLLSDVETRPRNEWDYSCDHDNPIGIFDMPPGMGVYDVFSSDAGMITGPRYRITCNRAITPRYQIDMARLASMPAEEMKKRCARYAGDVLTELVHRCVAASEGQQCRSYHLIVAEPFAFHVIRDPRFIDFHVGLTAGVGVRVHQ